MLPSLRFEANFSTTNCQITRRIAPSWGRVLSLSDSTARDRRDTDQLLHPGVSLPILLRECVDPPDDFRRRYPGLSYRICFEARLVSGSFQCLSLFQQLRQILDRTRSPRGGALVVSPNTAERSPGRGLGGGEDRSSRAGGWILKRKH